MMASPGLVAVLTRAREIGFLGPGPVEAHLDHAMAFAVGGPAPDRALDLGSGGGVPGLVLAAEVWPASRWLLVDAGQRRCEFLAEAVEELGLGGRVEVAYGRAEELGRDAALRGRFDLVVARGFARPPVTAECASPFLRVGGRMVVSEPPGGDPGRWPADGLALLGLVPCPLEGGGPSDPDPGGERSGEPTRDHGGVGRPPEVSYPRSPFAMACFIQASPCDDRYPRRTGVPAKRPLF